MQKNKLLIPILLFFLISVLLNMVYFYRLGPSEFYYLGDQFFRFNQYETFVNSFFLRKPENLGVLNAWQQMTQFWDIVYYLVVYSLGLSALMSEKILFFLITFLSLVVSFIGFKKISVLVSANRHGSIASLIAVTLFYNLNPYTLALWHGGAYNLGSSITYSLAPLTFYCIYRVLFEKTRPTLIIGTAFILFASSFTFWLFAVTVFFLGVYAVLALLILKKINYKRVALNAFLLGVCYLLLSSPILFALFHELSANAGDNNATFSPTYGNMQGGLWFQILMLFSWGMYTIWHPRSMYSFHEYFFGLPYIIATLSLYGLVIIGVVRHIKTISQKHIRKWYGLFRARPRGQLLQVLRAYPQLSIFILILGIALFFAKGAQPPFGFVFEFMYRYVPLFNVFRTPDIRFGFLIVLSISILLIIVSKKFKPVYFLVFVCIVIAIQSKPLLTGVAIHGENIPNKFFDRAITIPEDSKEIASHINSSGESITEYVLPIPAVEYGMYTLEKDELHLGQDLMAKITYLPFAYASYSNSMAKDTTDTLQNAILSEVPTQLNSFPIRYILLRNDVGCTDCIKEADIQFQDKLVEVLRNNTFTLYENPAFSPIVSSKNSMYSAQSPIRFSAKLQEPAMKQSISLGLSYNSNWKVFETTRDNQYDCDIARQVGSIKECSSPLVFSPISDLVFLVKKPLFEETHELYEGYGNKWEINIDTLSNAPNPTLTIFYLPQAWFQLFLLISSITSISMGIFMLIHYSKLFHHTHSKNKHEIL